MHLEERGHDYWKQRKRWRERAGKKMDKTIFSGNNTKIKSTAHVLLNQLGCPPHPPSLFLIALPEEGSLMGACQSLNCSHEDFREILDSPLVQSEHHWNPRI